MYALADHLYYSTRLHKSLQNTHETYKKCLCCLSQMNLISMNTCEHTTFIKNNIKHKLDLREMYICNVCHYMLKKIELFKRQIEESVTLLTTIYQLENVTIKKINNLNNSRLQTIDSTDSIVDFDVKSIVIDVNTPNHFDSDIKIENDSFDFEQDIPVVKIKTKKKNKQIDKYEGKIRIFMLTVEELREERENMMKSEKYLKLPYRCEYCITSFDHEPALKSHMEKRHTKIKGSYQCNICKSVLNSRTAYNGHTRGHFKRLECMECGKRYNTDHAAIQHYDEKHFLSGSSLQRVYTCRECDFTTTVHRAFRHHSDKHKPKPKCTLCSNTFVNDSCLKMHMYTVHKQSSRVYRCDPCNKTYGSRNGILTHMRSSHELVPGAYCAVCRTHYKSVSGLETHLKTHSRHVTDTDRKFICDECGAKFLKKCSLQSHITWAHLKLNNHTCDVCSKKFRNATVLRRHVDDVHNKQRPPKNKICHFCGKGFTTKNILRIHFRTHTRERPLQCRHCQATFAHPASLYTHIKLKHKGIK